jgi:hypothetical protein
MPVGELQVGKHGHGDDRPGQHGRGDQASAQRRQFGVIRRRGVAGGFGCALRQGRPVPGLFNLADENPRVVTGGGRHGGLLGRVVDGGRDAVELVQLLLDPGRAGGAGHAGDVELDQR